MSQPLKKGPAHRFLAKVRNLPPDTHVLLAVYCAAFALAVALVGVYGVLSLVLATAVVGLSAAFLGLLEWGDE